MSTNKIETIEIGEIPFGPGPMTAEEDENGVVTISDANGISRVWINKADYEKLSATIVTLNLTIP